MRTHKGRRLHFVHRASPSKELTVSSASDCSSAAFSSASAASCTAPPRCLSDDVEGNLSTMSSSRNCCVGLMPSAKPAVGGCGTIWPIETPRAERWRCDLNRGGERGPAACGCRKTAAGRRRQCRPPAGPPPMGRKRCPPREERDLAPPGPLRPPPLSVYHRGSSPHVCSPQYCAA